MVGILPVTIPINEPIIGREEIRAVNEVLKTGMLTSAAKSGGKKVQEFEGAARALVKSKFAVAVSSGTSALQAALLALGVGAGDEVLLPSFSFLATASAVRAAGARPVFVDILRENYTMDPRDLEKKITKKSRAVIPVHLYGNVAHMDEISKIAKRRRLKIVEDAAQSLGSTLDGRHTGTFGDIGCYSLYPAKVMTSGEGGLLVTASKTIHQRLLMIRNHGMAHPYDARIFGLNLRMPEIAAAIAAEQIKKLPKFLSRRRQNAGRLSDLLSDTGVEIPVERRGENKNWYLYTIALRGRDALMRRLNAAGFGAVAYYAIPIHRTPYYMQQRRGCPRQTGPRGASCPCRCSQTLP